MNDVYTMGIDVGSTTSKCVILKNGTEIAGTAIVSAGTGTTGPARAVELACEAACISKEDIAFVTATGYGRNRFEGADLVVSELTCHAKGSIAALPGSRTVIDIGGQDAKVISLDAKGRMKNFLMNDKCAAGTGRFLDVMARVLEMDVAQLGEEDKKSSSPSTISSTCTVFAESEVISQLSRGVPIPDIIAGIHNSVAVRTASLVKRVGITEPVIMTGGVAQNDGVLRALKETLGVEVVRHPQPQLAGAYGAAIHAWEKYAVSENALSGEGQ